MLSKALLAAAKAVEPVYVEDVFSTWLYTGNGSTQTITNGIDLSGKGGLVWVKARSSAEIHNLYDTARGANKLLYTNGTAAQVTRTDALTSFTSSGFTLGVDGNFEINTNNTTYASWTFRKAAKFFDVVTYVGDGNASKTISHNLGSTPGFLIVKRTDSTGQWQCYHRSLTSTNYYIQLNSTSAQQTLGSQVWALSSTDFTVYGAATDTNINGATYVAYLFAHDAGGFGDSGNDSVVKCGSYTGNGSTSGPAVTLGWEPQWLIVKRTDASANWFMSDAMRGMSLTDNSYLFANTSGAEISGGGPVWVPTATGFRLAGSGVNVNASGGTYIYIAIRRGPMKTPTDATKVFAQIARTGTGAAATITGTGFAPDAMVYKSRSNAIQASWQTRLQGGSPRLSSDSTAAESADNELDFGLTMDGIRVLTGDGVINFSSWTYINYFLRRAPGFFDVVAYAGTGVARTVSHNLGVVPELMIVKRRDSARSWIVYSSALGATKYLELETVDAVDTATFWNDTTPTSSVFSLGTGSAVNASGGTYIAYLFASCPGVSKVGSYTGTGTTQQINCGFTAGARFVMIKRTDSTGDWYVWDSARGIVAGNDPYLLLNSTAAEVTNTDYVDTFSAGFEISSTAPAAINANGGSFIFLAMA